ncbi:MAG: pelota family protein [Candidatus Aenigmarchaeota archaeon]|nr:pelota family protein [Candidatus Aenigmarchaeota archaeon]
MRLLKKEKDYTQVIPESLNDLWYLHNRLDDRIIEQKTLRTKVVKKGGEILKGKKVPQIIAIKVEKKKWDGDKVRATGRIFSGSERNKYHSLNLEIDKKIKVSGELKNPPKEKRYEILICIVDKSEADFRVYESGTVTPLKKVPAKGREKEFYKEISNKLQKEGKMFLLAGPGNTKEKIAKLLDREFTLDNLSCGGERGYKELLKRGSIKKIIEMMRDKKEEECVKRFLVEIIKNADKVCYGTELEKNIDKIKEILILSSLVPKYEILMGKLEKNNATINVVNDEKEWCREIMKFEIIGLCWY